MTNSILVILVTGSIGIALLVAAVVIVDLIIADRS